MHVHGFWQRLVKLQLAYAKGVEDLCKGKQAAIERLFKTRARGDREHVSSLRELWSKVVSEVEMMSSTQRKIGVHISQQIVQPIDSFVNRKLNKQVSLIGSGQNMLQTLKADLVAMSGERERYSRLMKAEAAKNAAVTKKVVSQEVRQEGNSSIKAAHSEKDEIESNDENDVDQSHQPSSKVDKAASNVSTLSPLEEQHKKKVEQVAEQQNRLFSVVLPGILEEVNMIERERIEMLCSCFNQFVGKANELLSTLNFQGTVSAIQTTLEASRQDHVVIGCPIPEVPVFIPFAPEHNLEGQHMAVDSFKKGQGKTLKQETRSKEPTETADLFDGDRVSEKQHSVSPSEKRDQWERDKDLDPGIMPQSFGFDDDDDDW